MEKVINDKKIPGDQLLGCLYNTGKVRKRREWRGFKDTMYDFGQWLATWKIMMGVSMGPSSVIVDIEELDHLNVQFLDII